MAGQLKINTIQLGDSATATNNFVLSVPTVPDGTVKLSRGNAGATTQDVLTISAAGVVTASSLSTVSATTGTMVPSANQMIGRNLIVNGSCQVDQVNSGAIISPLVAGNFSVDNWGYNQNQTGKLSGQQITTSMNSLGVTHANRRTVLSQFTPGASDWFGDLIPIEGLNSAHLQWGTADAAPVSLQFKARASVAGTYSGAIRNAAANRSYPFTFTLAANTATQIKIENIPGPTDGTWSTDNTQSINIIFDYGTGTSIKGPANAWAAANYFGVTGSTNLVSQVNGSTLDISDVQFEKGAFCTTFERKLYDQVLRECQRYYQRFNFMTTNSFYFMSWNTAIDGRGILPLIVPMRTIPTGGGSAANTFYVQTNTANYVPSAVAWTARSNIALSPVFTISGAVTGLPSWIIDAAGTSYIDVSARL